MLMLTNPGDSSQDDMNKFWTSFTSWYEQSAIVADYFKAEYTDYDNWNGGIYFLNIDFEEEYKIHYGISYPQSVIDDRGISLEELQDFVEIMYSRWIKTEKH